MLCFFCCRSRVFNKSITTLLVQTIANLSQFTKGFNVLRERIPRKAPEGRKEEPLIFPLEYGVNNHIFINSLLSFGQLFSLIVGVNNHIFINGLLSFGQ